MKTYKFPARKFSTGPLALSEVLAKAIKLSPEMISELLLKGGVWIQRRGKGKILRIRSGEEKVHPDDLLQVFHDPRVLKLPALMSAEVIYEDANYGVWVKEAGVVPQGTQSGDHASLLRYVELQKGKEVFLVHRLDRETKGLMIVAYHSKAAATLSDLFQKNHIKKTYEAIVLGELPVGKKETIRASLDDKEAVTHYEVLQSKNDRSLLRVTIETGRLHQIRRHLDFIGHPVMGDPKYGRGNKNKEGLKLLAQGLAFADPWKKKEQVFQTNSHLSL
jgi:tRNA pseudouridine32 synthase/23S rRNA pseudouridine746 synthase